MNKKIHLEYKFVEGLELYNSHADELTSASLAKMVREASESDYHIVLKRIEGLFDAEPNTSEGDELEKLISFIEAYEDKHYPI
ncbi:hypothetical protein MOVI109754_00055 [Moritella viscosa]|uniref:XRE family transcriptional regulator n=2 Tax=Moritella viscosa TaxID=80854 RepID=A0ABY1HFC6_9GAMM|nr:hypothetical protein [Moritella viscosa]SGY91458.1 Putative uncharacterized protein [Moritella viscosa]SGZ01389.1 Putative uncharacterized protein [Moritella viscosa]SHO26251.1 Putative uncharacterized protein [Moritella viscosa]